MYGVSIVLFSAQFCYFILLLSHSFPPCHDDHFFTRVYPSNPASCPKGVGNVESPRNTALPTTRGHETILNKKVVMSFTKGNRPSNAMKRHHHHAQNHARGHAMKKRRRAQTRLYKRFFFSAILMFLLEYFTEYAQ